MFWQQRELAAMEKEVTQVQMEACQLGQLHPVAQEDLAKQLAEVQEAWATLNAKVQERGRSWRRLPRATPSSDAVGNCYRWHPAPAVGSALPCRAGVTPALWGAIVPISLCSSCPAPHPSLPSWP